MKKYALIFSIAFLLVAVLVGVAGELFKLNYAKNLSKSINASS